jgi:sugar/nucleoside kinase (ribokinase family)
MKGQKISSILGGSPTNVAVNATRLGLNSGLVASCGEWFREYIIRRKLQSNNVITSYVKKISDKPNIGNILFLNQQELQILFHIEKPILKLFQVKLQMIYSKAQNFPYNLLCIKQRSCS